MKGKKSTLCVCLYVFEYTRDDSCMFFISSLNSLFACTVWYQGIMQFIKYILRELYEFNVV